MEHKYTCLDCGKEFTGGGYRPPKRRICLDCRMKHLKDTFTQLREKQGPYYEKWKQAMKHLSDTL